MGDMISLWAMSCQLRVDAIVGSEMREETRSESSKIIRWEIIYPSSRRGEHEDEDLKGFLDDLVDRGLMASQGSLDTAFYPLGHEEVD